MDQPLIQFVPVFIYLAVLVGFVVATLVMAHLIGPSRQSAVKDMTYESGVDPIGDARQHFDVRFYLMAVLFLVFDIELLFLYPWAVAAYAPGNSLPRDHHLLFWVMVSFLATLTIAYVYAWVKGVFRWR